MQGLLQSRHTGPVRLLPKLLLPILALAALAVSGLVALPSFLASDASDAEACPPGFRAPQREGTPRAADEFAAGLSASERTELAAAEKDFTTGSGLCVRTKHPESQKELLMAARASELRRGTPIGELKPGAYASALREREAIELAAVPVPGTAGTWSDVAKTPLKMDEPEYGEVNTLGLTDVAGRAGDFAYDPATDTIFSSSNAGGVWASDDGAKTWRSVGDGLPSQVVGAVGFTAADGGTIIAVSGDSGFGGSSFSGAGAFRSNDGGKTWTKSAGVPDGLLGFKVAVDPTNPSEIYLGTGGGLFRSTDAGRSYVNVKLPTSPECAGEHDKNGCRLANMVTDVAVQAPDTYGNAGGKVLAAVGWRAGTKQNADGTVQSPGNGLYLSDSGEPGSFQKSPQTGFTPQEQIGRIELGEAIGPDQNHNYVYALVQDAAKFNKGVPILDANEPPPSGPLVSQTVLDGVYVSSDFGESWTKVTDAAALAAPGSGSALTPVGVVVAQYGPGVQAWYNQFIEPDPTRQVGGIPSRLVFGLEEVWSSEVPNLPVAGPSSFKVIGRYYGGDSCQLLTLPAPACPTNRPPANSTTTHPDQHSAMFVTQGDSGAVTLLVANDGGVNQQTVEPNEDFDNGKWGRGTVQNMHTLQPYDAQIAKDGVIYAGLQDNGEIKILPDGKQVAVYGGDAFYSVVHPDDSNIVFEEYTNGGVSITNDGGATWRAADPALKNGPFSTPMVGDPKNPDHVLIAGRDVKLTTAGGGTTASDWQTVFDLGTQEAPGDAAAVGINNQASSLDLNGGTAYVGYCGHCDVITQGTPFRSGVATNIGGTWHIAKADGLPERMVTSVTMDPEDPKTVFATLGNYNRRWGRPGIVNEDVSLLGKGHVFKSVDGGETFKDVSGTLPDAPAYKVELRGRQLLVATEVGVFASIDREGSQWAVLGSGLPNVPVYSIEIQPGNPNRMIVATHGRGVWSYTFADPKATPSQNGNPTACAATTLATAKAVPKGAGLRFSFSAPVTVNLLRVAQGRRISDKNAGRFGRRSKAFTWKGSKKLPDGFYVARFSIGGDDRRVSLERRKGRFRARGATDAKGTCAFVRKIALNRPVFGGTSTTPLKVVLRLGSTAKVAISVSKGSKVVRRLKAVTVAGGRTKRLVIPAKGLKRGDHTVSVTVTPKTGKALKFKLLARRL